MDEYTVQPQEGLTSLIAVQKEYPYIRPKMSTTTKEMQGQPTIVDLLMTLDGHLGNLKTIVVGVLEESLNAQQALSKEPTCYNARDSVRRAEERLQIHKFALKRLVQAFKDISMTGDVRLNCDGDMDMCPEGK